MRDFTEKASAEDVGRVFAKMRTLLVTRSKQVVNKMEVSDEKVSLTDCNLRRNYARVSAVGLWTTGKGSTTG